MKIDKNLDGDRLKIGLEGELDTTTAPILEEELDSIIANIKDLVFDFEKLEYISSAGLRVILSTQQTMNDQGTMKVVNVNAEVMEVFEITGFVDILTIE